MYDKTDPLMVALPIGEIIQSCIHGKNFFFLTTAFMVRIIRRCQL